MACMICPKPICLELRLVSDKNENVADLTMENHTSHGPKQVPVGQVDVEILMRDGHSVTSSGDKHAFKPGERSLFIHNVCPYPHLLTFPMQDYDNMATDPQKWSPLKRGAVQIGNRQLQEAKAGQPKPEPSWARNLSSVDNWGYECIEYGRDIPILDTAKIREERKKKDYNYPKTLQEMNDRFGRQVNSIAVSLVLARKSGPCPKCGGPLYRLIIELYGVTSLRPRLHVVENWPNQQPPVRIGSTLVAQPEPMPLMDVRHRHNTLNLAAFSSLAYASLEFSGADTEGGSISDFFDRLGRGLARSWDEPTPITRRIGQPSLELTADTLPVEMYLERVPYGKGYLLENIQFFYDKDADAEGFAACDAETAIFAFRGTSSLQDVLTDISISAKKDNIIPGNLHTGFLDSINALKEQVIDYCTKNNISEKKIFVCGHSLGGAMATLMSFILQKKSGKHIILYTYGSPRAGDEAFVRAMLKSSIVHYRVVNHNDVVPRVPFNKVQKESLRKDISILLDAYLHYGNFCHLLQLWGYESMIVHISGGQEISAPLSDMRNTGDFKALNPIDLGADHFMTSYFPNIKQAIIQSTALSLVQMTEYQQRLNAALRRHKMGRCHP